MEQLGSRDVAYKEILTKQGIKAAGIGRLHLNDRAVSLGRRAVV